MAILRTNGFVQLRRGLMEHVMNGAMTHTQAFLYIAILANANPASGIWIGSAGVLSAIFSLPQRTCREAMERLEKAGYIKRFAVQGKHGSYPIFVHRFECSDGAVKGMRLNALDTSSYDNPIYVARHEDVGDDGNESGNDDGNETAGKYIDNKKLREVDNPSNLTLTPPSNGNGASYRARWSPGEIENIYQAYPRKIAKADALKAIKKALDNLDEDNPVAALRARVMDYAASPAGKKEQFVPYPARWFNRKHYLDDPKEWER